MENIIFLIPLIPFLGAFILAISGGRISKTLTAIIGIGTIGISSILTIITGIGFLQNPQLILHQKLFTWFEIFSSNLNLQADIAFHLDSLSIAFMFIITFVGFFIHLYSAEFMKNEEGYSRFFAYMNMFVGSMLTLVMSDNLILMYLGWEGVGLCSYLLIGFWYKDPANDYAARKAFTITRIGDTSMLIGLLILYITFGTLNISELFVRIPQEWSLGNELATITAILLLGGAVGKSAQLPLQTWLPDAMAGPSPVSALIHAATMVTAGVYLIARMNIVFILSPLAQSIVAIIGVLTLLIAGFAALTQHDLKRVLAYSTISQIGYMFLALGVGAFSAAIFHFFIHAFFKALLFLAAGIVIIAQHEEHDMFKMGGLKKKLPLVYYTFLIGSASLAALPLITAGFYSKDAILWFAYISETGSVILWAGAFAGAFITALYSARMVFVTFFGKQKIELSYIPGWKMNSTLFVLAVFSLLGGFIELPEGWTHFALFSDFVGKSLPNTILSSVSHSTEIIFQIITGITTLIAIYIGYLYFLKNKYEIKPVKESAFQHFLYSGWAFDKLYENMIVKPFLFLSNVNKNDVIDKFFTGIAQSSTILSKQIIKTQTGQLRNYVLVIVIGLAFALSIIVIVNY